MCCWTPPSPHPASGWEPWCPSSHSRSSPGTGGGVGGVVVVVCGVWVRVVCGCVCVGLCLFVVVCGLVVCDSRVLLTVNFKVFCESASTVLPVCRCPSLCIY